MAEAPTELLSKVPLFSEMKGKELKRLAESMTERWVEPGKEIATEGKQGVGFFVIEEGTARVSIGGEAKRTLGPGDSFGEIALITDARRTATVTAETRVHCWAIASWVFRPLVHDNAAVAWHLLDTMASFLTAD
jgi:CRP-like cAMP-binding protein